MNFVVCEKQSTHGLLLIVTDKEIVNKKFEEGNKVLDLTSEFYKGEEKSKEEVMNLFKAARHLHLTGEHIVELAKELDLVRDDNVLWVRNVPHAQVVIE